MIRKWDTNTSKTILDFFVFTLDIGHLICANSLELAALKDLA